MKVKYTNVCTVLPWFGNNNGGIMSFTKRLCEGYKKLKTSVKRDNCQNNEFNIRSSIYQRCYAVCIIRRYYYLNRDVMQM